MENKQKKKTKQTPKHSFTAYLNNIPVVYGNKLHIKNLTLPYLKSKKKVSPLKNHKTKWWVFCVTTQFQNNPCLKKKFTFTKTPAKSSIWVVVSGLFVGFINGFWGGGGGMVCVPTLTSVFGLPEKSAHATAILVMLPLSITSLAVYLLKGDLQFDKLWLVMLGFFVGGILGANLLKKMNNAVLQVIFAILIMAAGLRMLF